MPTFPVGGPDPQNLASVSDLETLLRRTFSYADRQSAALILAGVSAAIRTETGRAFDGVVPADVRSVALDAAARAFYNPESSIVAADGSGGFTAGRTAVAMLSDEEKAVLAPYRRTITNAEITTGCPW